MVRNDKLEIGSKLQLNSDKISRRNFFRTFVAAGAGIVGLTKAIETAYGEEPEGVPLVLTRDIHGNPDKVRIISKERYRRLTVFDERGEELLDESHARKQLSLTTDPNDADKIALELTVDPVDITPQGESEVPDEIEGVPIKTKEETIEPEFDNCSGGWVGETVDPIVGNASVMNNGTLCVVGFTDEDPRYKAGLTCYHVVDDLDYENEPLTQNNRDVGIYDEMDEDMDAVKYEITDDSMERETHHDDQPYIIGSWDFLGLASETHDQNLPASLSGRRTCYAENECYEAVQDWRVDYQANFTSREATGGDSGGPWIDEDGYLIAMHQGFFSTALTERDRGIIAGELFDRLNFSLSPTG